MSEMQRLLELVKTMKPLPRHVLHVERLSLLDSVPRAEPVQFMAPWGGIPVQVDAKLPPNVWEMRDEAGNVLATNARPAEAR